MGLTFDLFIMFFKRQGHKHLLAAVESLIFFPSREAKCCSKASRRLLGAWKETQQVRDRKNLKTKQVSS